MSLSCTRPSHVVPASHTLSPRSQALSCACLERCCSALRPDLSRVHNLLCRVTTRYHTLSYFVVRASLCTSSPVVCGRAFCRGQICHNIKILCRDRNSPYPGQLYRDLELLYRYIKMLSRDRKSSQPGQLCCDIELLRCNTNLFIWPHSVVT